MKLYAITAVAALAAATATAGNPWQTTEFATDDQRVEAIVRELNASAQPQRVSYKQQAPVGKKIVKDLVPQAMRNGAYQVMNIVPSKAVIAKSRAEWDDEENEEMYNVTITVKSPEKPGFYVEPPRAYLMGEDGYSIGFVEDEEAWQWGDSFDMYFPVAAGTYNLAVHSGYEAPNDNIGCILYSMDVEITGDCAFEIDFAECTNFIHLDAQMPDGSPFPIVPDDAPDNTPYPFAVVNLETGGGNEVGVYLSGIVNYNYYTNDLPAEAAFHQYVKYYDLFNLQGCALNVVHYGPFTEDCAITVDADGYQFIDAHFTLTPEEQNPEEPGIFFTFSLLTPDGDWLEQANTSRNFDYTGPAFNHVPIYMYLPAPNDQVSCTSSGLGTVVGRDENWGEDIVKHSPQYMSHDGTLLAVPNSARRDPETGLPTFLSTADVYNIDVDKQQPVYFSMMPYLSGNMEVWYDWEDPNMEILDFWGYSYYTGPYFESCSLSDPFEALSSVKFNGEETKLADMMGKSAKDASFEFTFKYNNQLYDYGVGGDVVSTIGYNTKNPDDYVCPLLTGYQMRDEDGMIANIIHPQKTATIYFSAKDSDTNYDSNCDITAQLKVCGPDGEWKTIECESQDAGASVGVLYKAEISCEDGIEGWYAVNITITDANGNYLIDTIPCALGFYVDPVSIRDVNADGQVQSVRYYDLNGRELGSPVKGVNIKASTLSNGQVKVEKQVVL